MGAVELIFVYGTLRKEVATNRRAVLVSHCEFYSHGYMQGNLYDLGGYPGALVSDDKADKVFGELHKIIEVDAVLPQLDEYEQCTDRFPKPHEYIRKKLPIRLTQGAEVTAWVYVFNHDISTLTKIESGDYVSYIKYQN